MASRRLLVSVTGLAAAGAYLLGAWLTGHLDPLSGRPVLDGFAPPPPYRWVSPPPSLAGSNERPSSVSVTVALSGGGESDAAAISTPDLQASLFVVPGSFAGKEGSRSVRVDIRPGAPDPLANPPAGLVIVGNVYAFTARYEPGGTATGLLRRKARVVLVYPGPPATGRHEHVLLASPDGGTWRSLPTTVANAQHQAAADVSELGFFVVGRRTLSGGGGLSLPVRLAVFVLLLVAAAALAVLGWRRRAPR